MYTRETVRRGALLCATLLAFGPCVTAVHGYSIIDLGTLGGTTSSARGVNDSGQVVGESAIAGDSTGHAFLYSGGVMTDLGTLGGLNSWALGINSFGEVVGNFSLSIRDSVRHAFLYSGGVTTDLGTLGGTHSFAYSINDSGQVVGNSYIAGGSHSHAFLYSGGVMTDLNDLLPPGSGWTLQRAWAINEAGWIAGQGFGPSGSTHGFLLTPEPTTLSLLALGGLVVTRRRR